MNSSNRTMLRKARQGDLRDLLDICNYEVTNGTATFDIVSKSLDEWLVRFDCHNV